MKIVSVEKSKHIYNGLSYNHYIISIKGGKI